jgi:pimeloyl-ACP methyl ester carboxylesterase
VPVASLDGVLLHFVVLNPACPAGKNADVVLVHRLGASLGFWYWKLTPALAASNRVLIFDFRGHGLSSMPRTGYTAQIMAADLKALLDFVGVTEAHFLGHSFGGRIIIHFACKYPERVKSIVLADVRLKSVQPTVTSSSGRYWSLLRAALARRGIRIDQDASEPAVAILEALARLRLNIQGLRRTSNIPIASPFSGNAGRRIAVQWLRLLDETTAPDDIGRSSDPTAKQLSQLNRPTLLVYGECSHAMPTVTGLKDVWPHARTKIIPDAGHLFPIAHPERLLAPVHRFLDAQH